MIYRALPALLVIALFSGPVLGQNTKKKDARNTTINKPVVEDPDLARYAIYARTAPRGKPITPVETTLPLKLSKGARICTIGNTLLDRETDFGHFEAIVQRAHGGQGLELRFRDLCWPADAIDLQPRPDNLADVEQHLVHEQASVILAGFGFNESFDGLEALPEFEAKLSAYLTALRSKSYNGSTPPQIVLVSPIPCENLPGVAAADRNNESIKAYTEAMRKVAAKSGVAFADVYNPMLKRIAALEGRATINGCHLTEAGNRAFAEELFRVVFAKDAPEIFENLIDLVADKNEQFFYRYRPVNSFYYTGGRSKTYGYLDFLPAMRNFDIMVDNRDRWIWSVAEGIKVERSDANVPPLPPAKEARGANEWMSASDELKAFKIDPRFEVNLFAGEEQFPEIACPVQIRWDAQGRLWVACSTTYPHVYPGQAPNDKIVILEDTDGDGRADKSSVWADDIHIPLSFEFGDGGVYVSEEPHLSFLKDTDGDGKADHREHLLTGFGCEDSHHALHDFVWTPDGDLILRESIFHHSQIETPYGPVRQANSGWFRFEPRKHRLTPFGTYHSTNPWGVTFDDWGQHVASHPIFASAFHARDPIYPNQHPKPAGLNAYSGTAGQEFIDFASWPEEMQGGYLKNRYKPTNRVEFLKWEKTEFGYDEKYVGDIIFSTNLSFIPVDLRFGPRGAMYVCDWYNPVKGHAQYSLRDPRRDRESGRIWRIVPKGATLEDPPPIADAPIAQLLENLERPEYRYRYWTKRELRERDGAEVKAALAKWISGLEKSDPRFRHHQLEALWLSRSLGELDSALLEELLACENPDARAAATRQLRYTAGREEALRKAANDEVSLVRMEAAIAASYIGTEAALDGLLDTLKHPHGAHLAYAMRTSFGSATMEPLWRNNEQLNAAHPELSEFLGNYAKQAKLKPSKKSSKDAQFDSQKGLIKLTLTCVKEQIRYDKEVLKARAGAPIRLDFINPDATPHNFALLRSEKDIEPVGMAANEMAKSPDGLKKGFIPGGAAGKAILAHGTMLMPDTSESIRFLAPKKPGRYPYICTFPGHWIAMKGVLIVE